MTGRCVLGIDAGTQSVKAGVWDLEGAALSRGSSPIRLSSPRDGWAEQDAEEWWSATTAAVRTACAGIDPHRLTAVGVAWQRESFTLADAAGRPLRPAMLWLDIRASREVEALGSEADRILELTGKPLDVTSSIPRLRWLRAHEPELFRDSPRWVDTGCFLLERLGGRPVSCVAGADTAGMIELESRDWSERLLDLAGLRRRDVPLLVEPGVVVGSIVEEASRRTGLPVGLPVVAAGGDGQVFVTGALGLPGESAGLSLTLGTSVVLGVPVSTAPRSPCYRLLIPAGPGGYLLEAVIQSGTYLFRWLEELLAAGPGGGAAEREAKARGIPIGSSGLVTVPHSWGTRFPHPLPEARGVTLGWSNRHSSAHLHRSLLEGIAFELRYSLEEVSGRGGIRSVPRITVGGGGSQSALWLSIIRDVLGLELRSCQEPEPVALGAAMIAAAATGLAGDMTEAARRFVRAGPCQAVDAAAQASYDELYREVYVPLRRKTLELSAKLSRLSREREGDWS